MTQKIWEHKEKKTTHFITVDHLHVVIGSTSSNSQSESAAKCSYKDFLGGRFHTEIIRIFSKAILNEVLATVKDADTDPVFSAHRQQNKNLLETLYATPLDASLANMLRRPDLEKGTKNYGNAGGYKSILVSDTLTMTVERSKGFLQPNEGGEIKEFTLPGHASATVAWQDHFYIVVNNSFVVITPKASIIKKGNTIFGENLRIHSVFRYDGVVFFSYRWFQNEFPHGWLRYSIGKGFTGRWVNMQNQ